MPMKPINNEGFRLKRFEVRDWGVFKNADLQLQCQNALLTGQNGAGKTTLVDGLVTLLIPTPEKFYNQSAGLEEKKKNRRREDYILGDLGKEEDASGETKYNTLRKKEEVITILLAVFYNEQLKRHVTLAHVYWFANEGLKSKYFVAPESELSIDGDFKDFNPNEIRKFYNANKSRIDNYDTFTQYASAFMKVLHIQEGKNAQKHNALLLFAKTVGIKVLGDLNVFIRNEMLDQPDFLTPYQDFKTIVKELNDTHQELLVAQKQEEILAPMMEEYDTLLKNEEREKTLSAAQGLIKPYFATQKLSLLEENLENIETEKNRLETQKDTLENAISLLQEQKRVIEKQIEGSEIGQEIKRLKREIEILSEDATKKKTKMQSYNDLAQPLSQTENPNADVFYKQLKDVERKEEDLKIAKAINEEKIGKLRIDLNTTRIEYNAIKEELDSLGTRNSNIPADRIRLREEIASALHIPISQLPFVGELIQIKKAEKEVWEMAIEQLLRPFALNMLVSKEHIYAVDRYVNALRLSMPFSHTKISATGEYIRTKKEGITVIDKLEIKEGYEFTNALLQKLNSFDYVCLPNTDNFEKHKFAITPEALIKRDENRTKNAAKRTTQSDFVLGWSNEEKKRELQRQSNGVYKEIEKIEKDLKGAESEKNNLDFLSTKCIQFLEVKDYKELNYLDNLAQMADYQNLISELEAKDTELVELNEKLSGIKEDTTKKGKEKDDIVGRLGGLKTEKEGVNKQIKSCENILFPELEEDWAHEAARTNWIEEKCEALQPYLPIIELSLTNIEEEEDNTKTKINTEISDIKSGISRLGRNITKKMGDFQNPTGKPENWADNIASTMSVRTADIAFISEYRKKYDTIISEELPELGERFRKKMEDDIETKTQQFRSSFRDSQDVVEDTITTIKDALQKVYFDEKKQSHLEIRAKENPKNKAVLDFKDKLNNLSYDLVRYETAMDTAKAEMRTEAFLRIKKFINEMDNLTPEKQKEVLDVRNWYTFETREVPQNGENIRIIEGTGKDSGGEKAKLTYTILMAALVYHFNIAESNEKSFRFIVVDEAFSKLDGDNSTFLLELCEQLNLQLLCITPFKDLNLVEEHVTSYFLVQTLKGLPRKSEAYTITKTAMQEERKRQALL